MEESKESLTKRIDMLENNLAYFMQKDYENRKSFVKMFENHDAIFESFVEKIQEINRRFTFTCNFIEYLSDNSDIDIKSFIIKNAVKIYNCDKNFLCKMFAKYEEMTESSNEIFKLLFFDISYDDLEYVLETAALCCSPTNAKWYKLKFLYNLVIQGYCISTKPNAFEIFLGIEMKKMNIDMNAKNIEMLNKHFKKKFLQKWFMMFNETDISYCTDPYNKRDYFFKNQIFNICYQEAMNYEKEKKNEDKKDEKEVEENKEDKKDELGENDEEV